MSLLIGCISIFASSDIQSLDSYLRNPNELQVVIEKKLETKQPEVSKFTKQGKLRTKAQMIAAERIFLSKSIDNVKASNKESLDSYLRNSNELQVVLENYKKWNILQIPSKKIWFINFGPYNLSRKAFELGIKTSTLIFTVIHSVNLMLLTTLQEDIVWGLSWFLYPLRKIGLPISKWLFQLLIALRFIPLVQEEFQNIIKSISVRSINFRILGFKKSFNVLLMLVERLFQNIFLRIDQGAESLFSKKKIIIKTSRFRSIDQRTSSNVIVNTLSICFICIAIFLRKLYGAL